jgi:rRNA maturation endonuclease Nob1
MTIEIKKTIRYKYECVACENDYIEQRDENELQFIVDCPLCGGAFKVIEKFIATYEIDIPDIETPTEPVK